MANVITKRVPSHSGDFEDDRCAHVEEGESPPYMVYAEDDTFGPVGRYVVCKKCFDEIEADPKQGETCYDCKEKKPGALIRQWRWYDFYAGQGDEPLHICRTCWDLPKHRERMREDREEMKAEFARLEHD